MRHITKSRNADKENERILNRDKKDPLAKSPYFAYSIAKEAGATADGAKALSKGDKNSAVGTGNLQHTAHIEKADGRAGTTSTLSPNCKDTLPKKSLNLLELLKQKQEKEKLAFENFKEQMMKMPIDTQKTAQMIESFKRKNATIKHLEKGEKVDNKDLINALESTPQKGRDMLIIGKDNLSPEVLEWAVKNNKKIAVDKLDSTKAKEYGFKFPLEVRRTISGYEIKHALNKHSKQEIPLKPEDIAKWTDFADNADVSFTTKDDLGQDVLVSAKQINGHYVVVESVRKKVNELAFKTMYFSKGKLENNPSLNKKKP